MLDEYPAAIAWLQQFPLVQREIGKQLLRSLQLVSHSEFERDLDVILEQLLNELGNENVALFSVSETVSLRRQKYNAGLELRKPGSSSDRIRNYAENFSRVHSNRVQAHPTMRSMQSERMRNVILIEDFIGTGKRIATFLRNGLHPSIKSWISYRWTKLWIVAYGACTEGIHTITRCGFGLKSNRIRLVTPVRPPQDGLTKPMVSFCTEFAHKTTRSNIPFGFGGIGATMVFEHSCPNNAPVILWSKGKRYAPGNYFKPIFPNRGIPLELRSAFSERKLQSAFEVLWDTNQYRLALAMLNEKKHSRESSHWPLLISLGLASRNGWDNTILATKLGLSIARVQSLRELAWKLGVLDSQTNQLTDFGTALLNRIRSTISPKRYQRKRKHRELSDLYYPLSCEGWYQY